MSNELLVLLASFLNISFIVFASRQGIEWLYSLIVINLVLVSIFGAKLITLFGFTTNSGNVFYACAFLATHFVIEIYGKDAAIKLIRYGLRFVIFFVVMSQITLAMIGTTNDDSINNAISTLFTFSLRVTFGSLVAYTFAQYINITVYEWLSKITKGKYLWFRSNAANILSQLIDSIIFFSIAFFDLPGFILLQSILIGWVLKIFVVAIGAPALYTTKIKGYLKK